MSNTLCILASGDVAPLRPNMASMFDHVRTALQSADLSIGQLETVISTRGQPSVHAKLAMRSRPEALAAISGAGYHVLSFAGNHCMDFGGVGFDDTLSHAKKFNIPICGAGQNLAEARAPVSTTVKGLKIAILAYSSIIPKGYDASDKRAGCAPLRAHTYYQPIEHDQPGTAARIITHPHQGDLAAMINDIKTAKQTHHLVLISVHWGIHFVPIEIADYQTAFAHRAIEAGADAIFGHHPHILKGIEIYKNKPIFYSLGNFAIEQPQIFDPSILQSESFKHLQTLNPDMDPNSLFVCPPDSHYSMLAKLEIQKNGEMKIGYQPIYINDASVPELIETKSDLYNEHLEHVRHITKAAKFATIFTPHDDGIEISHP